jgi:YHS domain-containing protein
MNLLTRRLILGAALALALAGAAALPATALAYDNESTAAINTEAGNVILHGYDPVAYFTAGAAVRGDTRYRAEHGGAVYHFSAAAHRDAFLADPARYVPQYGGFCAMGVALGKKLDVDPTQFHVQDGKLYLNLNAEVSAKWSEDVPGNLQKAELHWPLIRDQSPESL